MAINAPTEQMQLVVDYCAKKQFVPRVEDTYRLSDGWTGVSSATIQEGIKEEFGRDISQGYATWVWQRLGAVDSETDIEKAMNVLQDRRQEFIDRGFDELTDW